MQHHFNGFVIIEMQPDGLVNIQVIPFTDLKCLGLVQKLTLSVRN